MGIKASEQISIVDISDAYSVILTSETYTFVGNTSGAPVGSTCTTQAVAYCGATQCSKVNVTAASITCPTGISATVSNNGTASPTITFKTTSVITAACEAIIPVVVDGVTINKKFSFAVAKEGSGFGWNLIRNGNLSKDTSTITNDGNSSMSVITDSTYGYALLVKPLTGHRIYWATENVWINNVTYTVSFIAKSTVAGQKIRPSRSLADNGNTLSLTTEYKTYLTQIKCTSTVTGGTLSFSFDNAVGDVTITNVKLEKGTQATSWTPHPDELKGATGATGKGIKSTAVTYQASSSGTTAPTGTWSNSVQSVSEGQYLWTRTIITYTDNTTSTSYSVGRMGTNGTNGANGANGKSIGSITNYYLATSASSNVTVSTSGWTTTVQSVSASKKYLWNYEVVKYTDGTTASTTAPCIIGTYGDQGNKGDTGATGNGISKIAEHYAVSTSNATAPTSWSETVPTMTTANKYLWNYETITYTNGTTADTAKRVIGVYGNTGATGKGISSTTVTYQASTSGTTIPTGTWGSSIPTVSAGSYLWTKTVITYTDKTTSTSYSIGKMGSNGSNGAAGKGIKSTAITYQEGATGTTAPTGTWVSSPPATSTDKPYLWSRTVITYTDNTTSTSYSVGVPPNSVVSKGDVVNQVNAELKMEGNTMELKAGHFTIESDGLTLDADGNATFKGAVKASSGEFTTGFSVNLPMPVTRDTYGNAELEMKLGQNDDPQFPETQFQILAYRSSSSNVEAYIYNTIQLGTNSIYLSTNKSGGEVSQLFMDSNNITLLTGGKIELNGPTDILGTLTVDSNIRVTGTYGGVNIWSDSEGGNIRIVGPNNKHFWEIDSYQNTDIRLFHHNGSSYDRFYNFMANGTFNGWRFLQTDASSMESGIQWTGIKGANGSGNVIITCKPNGNYSQFLAYDNCNNNFIWHYNLDNKHQYYRVPLHAVNNLYIGQYTANIEVGQSQTLYIGASNESNYKVFLGVRNSAWRFAPNANACLDLGEPNFRWLQLYVYSATISTSDRNEKKDINVLFDDERYVKFFKKLIPVSFKMKDGKSGRTHVGFISQDVEDAMTECGLTSLDFAGFCKDQKCKTIKKTRVDIDENGTETTVEYEDTDVIEGEYIYSLRYEEFIALNTAMIQYQDRKIENMESRLLKLESKLSTL